VKSVSQEELERIQSLTASQIRCLRLVRRGMSSKEIALETGLSPGTVDQYLNRAASNLGVSGRREAARILDIAELKESKKFQLQSQRLAVSRKLNSIGHSGDGHKIWGGLSSLIKWTPPLGGFRDDLTAAETFREIVKASLIAAIAFGTLVATGAWLQSLFA
jgi:DNA-binding CsgD family transcriptional regulator